MDDVLVLELGVDVLGSVVDVFVNVDGIKKLIIVLGFGNYIIMVKFVVLVSSIVG